MVDTVRDDGDASVVDAGELEEIVARGSRRDDDAGGAAQGSIEAGQPSPRRVRRGVRETPEREVVDGHDDVLPGRRRHEVRAEEEIEPGEPLDPREAPAFRCDLEPTRRERRPALFDVANGRVERRTRPTTDEVAT